MFQGLSRVLSVAGCGIAAMAIVVGSVSPLHAQNAPGGFVVSATDGSVRALAYTVDQLILPKLWSWNDGESVSAGE